MWLGMFKHFNSMSFVDTTSAKMRKGIYILFLFRMLLEDFLVIVLFQCYPSVSCLYISFKKNWIFYVTLWQIEKFSQRNQEL